MKIIVVDDEPGIVQMCVRVLQSQGHDVRGFTHPEDALAQLRAEPAELLVVDYKMPEVTGLDFIKRAWELRRDLRVVMITAHGTQELLSQASETGVHTVVLKPFTPSELTQGIATALGGTVVDKPSE